MLKQLSESDATLQAKLLFNMLRIVSRQIVDVRAAMTALYE
jgi:hypothetical protein